MSGLRDPGAAVRGMGAAAPVLEAVVLLLAIQPLRQLGGDLGGGAIVAVLGLCLVAIVLAGVLRHTWAWWAGSGLQVALLCAGLLHWSLAVLGVVFGLAWFCVLYVRRRILH